MTFHDLHSGELPLLLPNAWDVPSALAFIDCGFTAVGTTSFGVASSQGSPDGGPATKAANLALAHALEHLDCRTDWSATQAGSRPSPRAPSRSA